MTLKEYMEKNHPEMIDDACDGCVKGCPPDYNDFSHMTFPKFCPQGSDCSACWNQEYIPKEGEEMGTKEYIVKLPDDAVRLNVVTVSENVNCCQSINVKDLQEYRRLKDKLAIDARKSGYKEGYKDGHVDGCFNACERLEDKVWDFAYEILDMSDSERNECFGTQSLSEIMSSLSYEKAKEQYDTYINDKKIKLGNEVEYIGGVSCPLGTTGYVISQGNSKSHWNVLIEGRITDQWYDGNFRKTGRHNPKLAEVIREISGDE